MARYVCHDVTLDVEHEKPEAARLLERVLQGLWWTRTVDCSRTPHLRLQIQPHNRGVPGHAQSVWDVDGFRGYRVAEDLYVTDGQSLLHVQPRQGVGAVHLASDFGGKPSATQQTFWMLGLLTLLRGLGYHILHAAGLVHPQGAGLVLLGPSGSGKSTLSLSLMRQGWHYCSDDTVLLRQQPEGVVALTWRKSVSIHADTAAAHADLPCGPAAADPTGRRKQRVCLEAAYPDQQRASSLPRLLLLLHVAPQAVSTVTPCAPAQALQQLLTQSGPLLFERRSMPQHVAVLAQLVQQARPYTLHAGRDVYQAPAQVAQLLATLLEGA